MKTAYHRLPDGALFLFLFQFSVYFLKNVCETDLCWPKIACA